MLTIYKYQFVIADKVIIKMPEGAKILSADIQNNTPTIWALVRTDGPVIERAFTIYGTGEEMNEWLLGEHIGTIQVNGFVWHIFE